MDHSTLIRHLSDYASTMIKDLKPDHARRYLRSCIPFWREHYGEDVARQMGLIIKQKFDALDTGGGAASPAA